MKERHILRACFVGLLVGSLLVNAMFIGAHAYLRYRIAHPGLSLDRNGYLVIEPGFTFKGHTIDFAGNGMAFHCTRFDSYKAWDWRPKAIQFKSDPTP
jgi:hypothetical protein